MLQLKGLILQKEEFEKRRIVLKSCADIQFLGNQWRIPQIHISRALGEFLRGKPVLKSALSGQAASPALSPEGIITWLTMH